MHLLRQFVQAQAKKARETPEVVVVTGASAGAGRAIVLEFARHGAHIGLLARGGAGPTKRIVRVLDQAGYHTSPLVDVPDGIHLVFLPPYSPELQPAEPRWQYCDQVLIHAHFSTRTFQRALFNAHFATIDDLEDTLADPCDRLQRQQAVIRSATHFHWWPAI